MATYGRADVYINEIADQLSVPTSSAVSTAAFIGEHWRGPTNLILINSWPQFVSYFGGFLPTGSTLVLDNPWLPYAVNKFFLSGGSQCYVGRIVGTGGSNSTFAIQSNTATPSTVYTATAESMGSWGNNVSIDVVVPAPLATPSASGPTFTINVYYNSSTQSSLVETWTSLSNDPTNNRYAPSIINSPVSGSSYITLTDNAQYNAPLANYVGVSLTGGTDCTSPSEMQREAAFTAGSSPFDIIPGVLAVNMPGETDLNVVLQAVNYAEENQFMFIAIDPPTNETPAGAVSYYQSITPTAYGALYYPWLTSSDPSTGSSNIYTQIPPGGWVVAKMVTTDAAAGPWQTPAGTSTVLKTVLQPVTQLSNANQDLLYESNVNPIIQLPNIGTIIWGGRTLETGYTTKFISIRRTLSYIEYNLVQNTMWAVFQPNNALLWSTVTEQVSSFLSGIWQQGGLMGASAAQSFFVICDDTVNTPATMPQGIMNCTVGVALQYPAEYIVFTIGQSQSGSSVIETSTPLAA